MGKPDGFMEYQRLAMPTRSPDVRLQDFYEIYERHDDATLQQQGARCMDCGVAFCQSDTGCPIDNLIPEWNDLVYHDRWEEAYHRLVKTNNFPEFTGRICPAPCESACVLGIIDPPVTIKSIECAIIDRAWEEGWVMPSPPDHRTGKTVAVIGSGPAGLAAADQLNKAGHTVTVYERDDRIGGLLMYGVPNMKLDKGLVQRRVDLLADEGVIFKPNHNVGGTPPEHGQSPNAVAVDPQQLMDEHDAVLLACGALKARDLDQLPGRELQGVHRAMQFLTQSTQHLLGRNGDAEADAERSEASGIPLTAANKHVVVIGGGDTGTDCIGTAIRQGCQSITNITRRQREPDERDADHPWPGPSGTFYIDYGHAEGAARFGRDPREYQVLPKAFVPHPDDPSRLGAIRVSKLEWYDDSDTGRLKSREVPGSDEDLPADLVLLAIGFTGHDTPALLDQLGVATDRGVVDADYGNYATSVPGVFAAGDMRRGASLIVWAIAEGRGAARAIDAHLMGHSDLPAPDMAAPMSTASR
jgi:glutamate synthase (NADPH/NADH) small chain